MAVTGTIKAPPNRSRFPASEIAQLDVNNLVFTDWESIWVQHRWHESFNFFRFVAAERTPPPANWTLLQFKPSDPCTIFLAGQPALTGQITDRQVSFDAERHQVQLIGKSWSYWGYKSSVDTKTGSFDGQTLEQVYTDVMSKYPNATPTVIGAVNPIPFQKLQNEPGELTWDFIERIARPRGAVLGTDHAGNYLLVGQHSFPVIATLKEGHNIKACECLISHDEFMQAFDVRGQTAGSDSFHGSAANEMTCVVTGQATLYSKLITPAEQPVATQAELCDRAYNEAKWHAGTEITANIVVYGWTYDGVHLWQAGQNVFVDSRMAMLNMVLKVRTVTFEQNDQVGTQTTLELVAPWLLNDDGNWNVGVPGAPTAPTPNPQGTPTTPRGTVTIGPITPQQ
jgi:prophage tail gpP-like protein